MTTNLFLSLKTDANPRKKKVYEQQENEENPLRCPVRLYEFYLSKWFVIICSQTFQICLTYYILFTVQRVLKRAMMFSIYNRKDPVCPIPLFGTQRRL